MQPGGQRQEAQLGKAFEQQVGAKEPGIDLRNAHQGGDLGAFFHGDEGELAGIGDRRAAGMPGGAGIGGASRAGMAVTRDARQREVELLDLIGLEILRLCRQQSYNAHRAHSAMFWTSRNCAAG